MAQPALPISTSSPSRDPLGPVLALGERAVKVGAVIGFVGAVLLHGVAGLQAAANLYEVEGFAERVADYVRAGLELQVEIDAEPPPPPPPEPEPPAPTPEPEVKEPPPLAAPTPPDEPPPPAAAPAPAPAEAGNVLTAEPDPNEPVDLTDNSIVTGTGEYRGGITSSSGTAKTAVRDVKAQPGGVVGGTGTAPAPAAAPPPGPDLSRPARPTGTSWSDCGFPAEAQLDGVEFGIVKLVVTVGTDGRAKSVTVLSDPGSGFGSHARQCAMRRTFQPGLDRAGQPIVTTTAPFTVKFTM